MQGATGVPNIKLSNQCFDWSGFFRFVNWGQGETFTVYPKKYAHGFCFAVLCCGYTLTDFPISIRLTSLALWQSNDCPSASKATLMNMDEYFMWIHYERLHNHNKAKHNKTVCIFHGIYCTILKQGTWLLLIAQNGLHYLVLGVTELNLFLSKKNDTAFVSSCARVGPDQSYYWDLDIYSPGRHRLVGIGIPIINVRSLSNSVKFIMGIPIPEKNMHL